MNPAGLTQAEGATGQSWPALELVPTLQGKGIHAPLEHPYFRLKLQVWGWGVLCRLPAPLINQLPVGRFPQALWGLTIY